MLNQSFVIFASQRTGSNALLTMLNNHPDIICFSEVFLEQNESSYSHFKKHIYATEPDQYNEQDCISSFLEGLYSGAWDEPSRGFKLMYDQLEVFPFVLDWVKTRQIKILHLTRHNKLRVFLSMLCAQKSDVWHLKSRQQPIQQPRIKIELKGIVEKLKSLEFLEEKNRKRIENLHKMELVYEELFGTTGYCILRETFSFLGVNPDIQVEPDYQRILIDDVSEIVVNYAELEHVLEQHDMAGFLS